KLRLRYRTSRAALYQPAIELVLMEEPFDAVLRALRPKRLGDTDMIQQVMVDAMRHLSGAPFDTLHRAARELGFINKNISALRSPRRHRRGRAMDLLGVMRATEAVPAIVASLDGELLHQRLVALRALAAIGDPAALPSFVAQGELLPPPLLPRLVSLMFEFGEPGRKAVAEIINRHPRQFPPTFVKDILMQLATDFEVDP
ncbi:MAG: HEAT repeat domain-containing protein, partial [Elusimicrobia bacterium]|nr:HEAT repeat domain-containing protein [Elusimicrobiota bacterium]